MVFSATPLGDLTPYHIARRRSGVASEAAPHPPAEGNGLYARAGGCTLGSYLIFSPRNRVLYSGVPRGAGAPGGERSPLATLSSSDCLLIKCRLRSRKGPLEGDRTVPAPGRGFGGAASALAGIPGKSPPPPVSAPQTQKRTQEARGARVCQLQRSASDPRRRICQ